MDSPSPVRFPLWPLLLFVAVLLAFPVAFLWLHLTTPFDGGRLMPDTFPISAEGLRVTPPEPMPGGLEPGDVVIAIEGRTVHSWAEALFAGDAPRPPWETNPNPRYTVLRDGQEVEVTITPTAYPLGTILRTNWGLIVFGLIFLAVASFVLSQRPQLLSARLLFLTAASVVSASTWSLGVQVTDFLDGRAFWLYEITTIAVYMLYWIAGLHFTMVFPQPLPIIAARWRVYLLYGLPYILMGFYLWTTYQRSTNILAWIALWEPATLVHAFTLLILTLISGAWQYRISRGRTTRQQAKWVIWAGIITGGLSLIIYLLPPLIGQPPANTNTIGLIVAIFPLALAAAILRYRLFDIDVLIRRTLVYTVLSALLVLVYLVSVITLQFLFTDLIGAGSNVAIVVSTLMIAAIFTPLRHRVQAVIDRRFYRQRYDAQQVLARFAATIRHETDQDQLTAELVQVVSETVQPTHVSVWHVGKRR